MTDRDERASNAEIAPPTTSGLPVLPPLAAIIEILALVVLPGLLDYVLPAFPSLNEMQPHFFWLPVLLLTLQYGTVSGLLAAGTAIVLTTLLGWPEQDIGENHFSYLLRIWLQPVLWISAAVILGQLRLRQIERKEALGNAVAELTSQRQAVADHAANLRLRCERLERVIASRREPDVRLLLAELGRLQSANAPASATALHAALDLAFPGATTAVYLHDGSRLRLADRHGAATSPPTETIATTDPLHTACIDEGRTLSVFDASEEGELNGHGVAAVPIPRGDGTVAGLLLLESAAPGDIDDQTALRLGTFAALIAARLGSGDAAAVAVRGSLAGGDSMRAADSRPWRRVKWRGERARASVRRVG